MEKQLKILEMAKDICRVTHICNDVCNPISACDALKYAERAVEAGYVKVVRCKDCKFMGTHRCVIDNRYKLKEDFCSRGKPKKQKMKIIEINKDIKRLVDENGGYCPCALVKDKDTKCICKEFMEQTTPGTCHCGRFEKVEVSDND